MGSVGRREMPRYDMFVPGRLRTGRGEPHDIRIVDLSEHGCCFKEKTGWLKEGGFVSVRIGSLGPILATIRWVQDKRIGIQFHQPIYGPVFEHLQAVLDEANPGRRRYNYSG